MTKVDIITHLEQYEYMLQVRLTQARLETKYDLLYARQEREELDGIWAEICRLDKRISTFRQTHTKFMLQLHQQPLTLT